MLIRSVLSCLLLLSATTAHADTRTFIIANQADGYGVDQCLANGEPCGSYAAQSYCQSREFAKATTYHRIDATDVTGAVPVSSGGSCGHAGCRDYVAITCQR